jgi:integrase
MHMQHGSLETKSRLQGPDVWQFRWSEKDPNGRRVYRKRVIGTVEEYADEKSARNVVSVLISEGNWANQRPNSIAMTISQLCSHFEQRELACGNTWRSYSTKRGYAVYLRRWIVPRWGRYELPNIRTIEVEYWLRRLPLAKSSCAKIQNVMSVLFNHACRYEFFDRNPIRLVRQGAKRKSAPNVLTPDEIKTLVDGLALREKTLVLIAASTGLRQSELFGLKWGDINRGRKPYLGQAILRRFILPRAQELGIQKHFGWHTFRHTYSTLLRSVGTEFKVIQELLRHSSLRSTLDVYTQAITPSKHAAQAAVMSLVLSARGSSTSPPNETQAEA